MQPNESSNRPTTIEHMNETEENPPMFSNHVHTRHTRRMLTTAAVLPLFAVAACSSGDDGDPGGLDVLGDSTSAATSPSTTTGSATSTPEGTSGEGSAPTTLTSTSPDTVRLEAHDPPKEFADQEVPLQQEGMIVSIGGQVSVSRWTLAGEEAYVTTPEGVAKVDLSTGSSLWTTPPPGGVPEEVPQPFVTEDGPRAPVVSADGEAVYNATIGSVPSSGTEPGHSELVVQALSTATGEQEWEAHVAIPRKVVGDYVGHTSQSVVAEDSGVVVAQLQVDGNRFSAGVDAASGETEWTKPEADALGVTGSVVLLAANSDPDSVDSSGQLLGVSVTTGEELWAIEDQSDIRFVGSVGDQALLLMNDVNDEESDLIMSRIDVSNGKIVDSEPGYDDSYECSLPIDASSVLCESFSVLAAIDPNNLEVLWWLPGKNDRLVPVRPVAYGPYVYGLVNGEGVILDALTGKDVTTNRAAPFVLGPYGGIGLGAENRAVFYPATG